MKYRRLYSIFHVSLLEYYNLRESSKPLLSIEIEGEEKFEIERIIEKKVSRKGEISYLVRWKGYPPSDDSWVKKSEIHAEEIVKKFEQKIGWEDTRRLLSDYLTDAVRVQCGRFAVRERLHVSYNTFPKAQHFSEKSSRKSLTRTSYERSKFRLLWAYQLRVSPNLNSTPGITPPECLLNAVQVPLPIRINEKSSRKIEL